MTNFEKKAYIKQLDKRIEKISNMREKALEKVDWSKMTSFEEFEGVARPYDKAIGKFSRTKRELLKPKMKKLSEFGDLMTLQDFKECCECGGFIDYDGYGYYSDGKMQSDIAIYPSDIMSGKYRKDFSHVVWFNR